MEDAGRREKGRCPHAHLCDVGATWESIGFAYSCPSALCAPPLHTAQRRPFAPPSSGQESETFRCPGTAVLEIVRSGQVPPAGDGGGAPLPDWEEVGGRGWLGVPLGSPPTPCPEPLEACSGGRSPRPPCDPGGGGGEEAGGEGGVSAGTGIACSPAAQTGGHAGVGVDSKEMKTRDLLHTSGLRPRAAVNGRGDRSKQRDVFLLRHPPGNCLTQADPAMEV